MSMPDFEETEKEPEQTAEMTLVGHLSELRQRIVWSVAALIAGTFGAYYHIDELMRFVTAPAGKLYFMAPAEGFFAYLKLAVFAGFMLALPVILWQFWLFVAPALTGKEN